MTRAFRFLMGTSIRVEAQGGDEEGRAAAIDEAFAAVEEVDRLMSNYRPDSELSEVNRSAAARPARVSDPLLRVLEAAQSMSRASDGAFDVTVGPAVKLWGFFDKHPHEPTGAELQAIRPLVNFRNLVVDGPSRTVRFVRPGVDLDLGGIAKGFAVELAAGVLRRHGLNGLVDAGGNQYMVGKPLGKRQWSVGVRDPDAPNRLLGAIDMTEGSVSTSANDSNFLVSSDGRRYGHLLDPRTLRPSTACESVTIVSKDGTLADAMSKAAFVLGPQDGIALIDSYPDMGGVVAYRRSDGRVALRISKALAGKFHPAASPTSR
ncbi:MAG TPA: FAD:protein FMN transferase [Vicinamibacterales bacterium]